MYLRKNGTKEIFIGMKYDNYKKDPRDFQNFLSISKNLVINKSEINYEVLRNKTKENSIMILNNVCQTILLPKFYWLLINLTNGLVFVKNNESVENEYELAEDNDLVYLQLLSEYKDKQMIVAVEEFSELQKEICKGMRNKLDKEHLAEEIADAEIMIRQVKLYYDIPESAVDEQIQAKLKRTKERYLNHDKN